MRPTSSVNALVLTGFFVAAALAVEPRNLRHETTGLAVRPLPPVGVAANSTKLSGKTRPLEGKRLQAFCYLKFKFQQSYKINNLFPTLLPRFSKSCAMVSSSGALRGHAWGKDIDAHDAVFRFNKAPDSPWEKNVGGRTDFRLGHDFPKNCPIQVCEAFPSGYTWHGPANGLVMEHIFPNARKPLLTQTTRLSSGFHGMLWGLANCGSLSAYEMTPSRLAAGFPYHYWEDGNGGGQNSGNSAAKNDWHGYANEEHYLWRWISTTPDDEVLATGKSEYPSFDDVDCPANYMADGPPINYDYQPTGNQVGPADYKPEGL